MLYLSTAALSVVEWAGGFGGVKDGTNVGSGKFITIVQDEETKMMGIDNSADLKLAAAVRASPATSKVDEAVSAVANEYPTPFKPTALACA